METWTIDGPKTIDLELVRRVKVTLMGGQVDVIGSEDADDRSARLEVSALFGRDLRVTLEGDTLIIDHPQLAWNALGESARALFDQPRVTVSLAVGRETDVQVRATSADVLVAGIDADVSLTTMGGQHFADRCRGRLKLTSGTGELSVRDQRGTVEVRTVSGDITVQGQLERFDGNTVSGATIIDISEPPAHIDHSSVSGNTSARLPAGSEPTLHLNSLSGRIRIDDQPMVAVRGWVHREAPDAMNPGIEAKIVSAAGAIAVFGTRDPGEPHNANPGPSEPDHTNDDPRGDAPHADASAAPESRTSDQPDAPGWGDNPPFTPIGKLDPEVAKRIFDRDLPTLKRRNAPDASEPTEEAPASDGEASK